MSLPHPFFQLSECELAVQEVEAELRAHSKQWEGLNEAAIRDSTTITQLSACQDQLDEELKERTHTVEHLEGLLQEVSG